MRVAVTAQEAQLREFGEDEHVQAVVAGALARAGGRRSGVPLVKTLEVGAARRLASVQAPVVPGGPDAASVLGGDVGALEARSPEAARRSVPLQHVEHRRHRLAARWQRACPMRRGWSSSSSAARWRRWRGSRWWQAVAEDSRAACGGFDDAHWRGWRILTARGRRRGSRAGIARAARAGRRAVRWRRRGEAHRHRARLGWAPALPVHDVVRQTRNDRSLPGPRLLAAMVPACWPRVVRSRRSSRSWRREAAATGRQRAHGAGRRRGRTGYALVAGADGRGERSPGLAADPRGGWRRRSDWQWRPARLVGWHRRVVAAGFDCHGSREGPGQRR